jgi:UDP-N-acetylmuramoyl-L-alanyl-D-glutamate--2,6-diaminopimelate ligase
VFFYPGRILKGVNIRTTVKKLIPRGLFPLIEPYGHLAEAVLFNALYGFPARNLKVIGVTGTNGKTTTCFMIHRMLHEAGYKVGMMTTVAYGVGDNIRPQIHHMTTVPVPQLLRRIRRLRAQGAEWLVLETTSHALAQHRVWGVPYSVAVMTNVTHEHLDYHKTFERYRAAKVRLFRKAARNYGGLRTGIVNADDPSWHFFADVIPNVVSYGIERGELRAEHVRSTPAGSDFTVKYKGSALKIHTNLPGSFNVSNALAAAATGVAVGLTDVQIASGIAALKSVEGRMVTIDEGQDFSVIVDYAHTPDSFEKLFNDLRPLVKGRLIVMFGSAGRRDEAKRAVQGKLAGAYADEVVLTEEDDRDIDGMEILNQIASGAEAAGKVQDKNLFLVHDRTKAIAFTLRHAHKGDTVLLLGKGHEKTIERADGENPWDEDATVRSVLKRLLKR